MVDFLIIGLKYSISYRDVVPLFVENRICFGYNSVNCYENGLTAAGWWFSNVSNFRPEYFNFKTVYVDGKYKKFDECQECINIDNIDDIPDGYFGMMGVPPSTIIHINRDQFDVLGIIHYGATKYDKYEPIIDGKYVFHRWIIKRKK